VHFEYHEPTSVREAVELGARFGADGRFLAGGTDLLIQMRRGQLRPQHVVSLHRVPGLDAIDVDGAVALGARVTHRRLEREPDFQGALQALIESAEVVGGHQIRNVATVGGNIVNASPAADVVPVLLALDAEVTCLGPGGERSLPLEAFASAPGVTASSMASARVAGFAWIVAASRTCLPASARCPVTRCSLACSSSDCQYCSRSIAADRRA